MKKIFSYLLMCCMLFMSIPTVKADDISDIEIPNGTILECYTDEDIKEMADMLFQYLDPKTDTANDVLRLYNAGKYKESLILFRNYMIDRIRKAPMVEIPANLGGYGQAIWHNTIDVICGNMTIDEFNNAHKSNSGFTTLSDPMGYLDYIDYTEDSHIDWTAKAESGYSALPVPSYAGLSGRFAHKYATTRDEDVIKRYFQIMYDYAMNYRNQIEAPIKGMTDAEKTTYAQETDGRVYVRLGGRYAGSNLAFAQKANDLIGGLGIICKALPGRESDGKSFSYLYSKDAVFTEKLSDESYDLIDPVRFAGLCYHLMKSEMWRVGGYITCSAITNQKLDGLSGYFRYAALFNDFTLAWDEIEMGINALNTVMGSTYHADGGILEKSFNYNAGDANSREYLRAYGLSMAPEMAKNLKDYSNVNTMWNRLEEGYKSNLGLLPAIGNVSNRGTERIWESSSEYAAMEQKTASNRELGYTSIYYPYSGYVSLRNNWNVDGLYMGIYNNPNSYDGHYSAASNAILNLTAYGRTMLLSGGAPWYGRDYCKTYTEFLASGYDEINGYFAEGSGRKNSTVMVNNRSQAHENALTATAGEKILDNKWHSSDSFDFTEGTWSGRYTPNDCEKAIYSKYEGDDAQIQSSADHTRQIIFLKDFDMWVALDKMDNKNSEVNEYTQVWNFAQYQENSSYADGKGGFKNKQVVYDENAKTINTNDTSGPNLFMMSFSNEELTYEKKYGEFITGQTGWGWSTGGGSNYVKTGGYVPSVDMLVKWKDKGVSGESTLVATVLAPSKNSANPITYSEDLSTEDYIGFIVENTKGSVIYYSSQDVQNYDLDDIKIKAKTVLFQSGTTGIKGIILGCTEFNGKAPECENFEFTLGQTTETEEIAVPTRFDWVDNEDDDYIPVYNNEQLYEVATESLDLSMLDEDFENLNRADFDAFVSKYWAYFEINYDLYMTIDYPEYIYDKLSEEPTMDNFGRLVNEAVADMKITRTENMDYAIVVKASDMSWPKDSNTRSVPTYVGFDLPVGKAVEAADIVVTKANVDTNVRALKMDRYIATAEHPEPLQFNETIASGSDKFREWNNYINENQKDMSDSLATVFSFPIGEVTKAATLPEYIIKGINEHSNFIVRMYGGDNMAIYINPTKETQPKLIMSYDKSVVYKALESYKTYDDAVAILEEIGETIDPMPYKITDVSVSNDNGVKSINSVKVEAVEDCGIYMPQVVSAIYNSDTDRLEAVKVTTNDDLAGLTAGGTVNVTITGCSKVYTKSADEYYGKVFIMDLNTALKPLSWYTYAD